MREQWREKIVAWTVAAGEKILPPIEKWIGRRSLVGENAFFAPEQFPWTKTLEANWQTIRAELDEVLKDSEALPNFQDISADQATITDDDRWKTFFLYGFGFKAEGNCRRCPQTARLLASVPGMKTAFFSVLSPRKHIPDHRGPYKGVLRYHLGLKVPEPREGCRIRVGEDIRHWDEGASMVFDDTYNHEAWNDTDGTRVVLFMDVVRPLPSRSPPSTGSCSRRSRSRRSSRTRSASTWSGKALRGAPAGAARGAAGRLQRRARAGARAGRELGGVSASAPQAPWCRRPRRRWRVRA